MNENSPHLPNNSVINGYRILDLLSSGDSYYLYKALSPDGKEVKLREFCPHSLGVRDPETFKIRYQESDIAALQALKSQYDAQFSENHTSEFQANGTSYFVYESVDSTTETIPQIAVRERKQRRQSEKVPAPPYPSTSTKIKSEGNSLVIPAVIVASLAIIGFFVYQLTRQDDQIEVIAVKPIEEPEKKPVAPEPTPEPVIVEVTPEPEPDLEPDDPEEITPTYSPSQNLLSLKDQIINQFIQNKGQITPSLQQAYAKYAEQTIREYVTEQGGRFSEQFEEWLKKTNHNQAIFASIYPPDPSTATNADILVRELGERAYQYDQLLVAFAIGRRTQGLGSTASGQRQVSWDRPCDLFIAGKRPVNFFGTNPKQVDEETYNHVRQYLTSNNLTPKQAWINKKQTVQSLSQYGVSNKNILSYLQEDLYRNDQMKRKRDHFPTAVEYMTFIIDKYEEIGQMRDVGKKKVSWTGIPLDLAPWQSMLPLTSTRPIRECEALWDRYLGKLEGKRIWRYGHYRRDDDPKPPALYSLDPDPNWSLESYERQLYVGGVCGTMANIECTSRIGLGSPAVFSSQPGHANLMYYTYSGNGCKLDIAQSVDTVKSTTGYWWLFDHNKFAKIPAIYHIGLALSLNLKNNSSDDSRLAMNIYKMVYGEADNKPSDDLKETALRSILALNPFHTEVWFELFNTRGKNMRAAIRTIDDLHKVIPDGNGTAKLWVKPVYNKNLGRTDKNFKSGLTKLSKDYTDALVASIIETSLKNDPMDFSNQEWNGILKWMQNESKKNSYEEVTQAHQVALVHSKGTKGIVKTIERDFDQLAKYYARKNPGRRALKVDPDELAIQIDAVMLKLPKEQALPWINDFLQKCPESLRFKPKPGRGAEITNLYKSITTQYMKLADESVAINFRDTLKKQREEYILATHGSAPIDD